MIIKTASKHIATEFMRKTLVVLLIVLGPRWVAALTVSEPRETTLHYLAIPIRTAVLLGFDTDKPVPGSGIVRVVRGVYAVARSTFRPCALNGHRRVSDKKPPTDTIP